MKQWIINYMECKPTEGPLTNVVLYVSYTRVATEIINNQEYSAQTSGILTCPSPDSGNFVPYYQLTKEIVDGWLDQFCGVVEIDNFLDAEIYQLSHPQLVILPLPFNN